MFCENFFEKSFCKISIKNPQIAKWQSADFQIYLKVKRFYLYMKRLIDILGVFSKG